MFTVNTDPDVLTSRSGGGALMILFGLAPLAIGVVFTFSDLLGLKIEVEPGTPPWAIQVFGLLPLLIGLGFVFGRGGVSINRRTGVVERWWGLLVPLHRRENRVEQYSHVQLTRELRRSKNSSYYVYPVGLGAEHDSRLVFHSPRNYSAARAAAEQLAKFLNKPLRDSSSGALHERAANELDKTVVERLRETVDIPRITEPPDMHSQLANAPEGGIEILIPPPNGRRFFKLLVAGFGLVTVGGVLFWGLRTTPGPGSIWDALPIAFPLVVFGGVAAVSLTQVFLLRTRVHASREGLRVEFRSPFSRASHTIPATELEELSLQSADANPRIAELRKQFESRPEDLAAFEKTYRSYSSSWLGRTPIHAQSDREQVSFGAFLPEDEKKYLVYRIEQALIT